MSETTEYETVVDLEARIARLLELGVTMLPEQIDYVTNPANRYAVSIVGIADPDCLYIMGPDHAPTLWQIANPGEPQDNRGKRACVLPGVIQGMPYGEGVATVENYWGTPDDEWPSAIGYLVDADWTWQWMGDEYPLQVVAWDLWPIDAELIDTWTNAATACWGSSKMDPYWQLVEAWHGGDGESISTDEIEQWRTLAWEEKDPDTRQEIWEEIHRLVELEMVQLEKEVVHEQSGNVDPQFLPIQLPPELDAIWSSLQVLSEENWDLLAKLASKDDDALYGRQFVNANRRLCPWY